MKLLLAVIVVILCLCACSSPKLDDYVKYKVSPQVHELINQKLIIELSDKSSVDFRGVYEPNAKVDSASILYSGDAGVAGVFAQIATHAAMNSSARSVKLSKQQIEANKVLEPFNHVLADFTQGELMHSNKEYSFNEKLDSPQDIYLKSYPIFFVSQDLRTISLKQRILVFRANDKDPLYQNLIEVVSPAIQGDNPHGLLLQEDGALLKKLTKNLYKESLSFVISDIYGEYKDVTSPQKSYRFYQGESLRVERGVRLESRSESMLIRNLRGWLVAFPNTSVENS